MLSINGIVSIDENGKLYVGLVPMELTLKCFIGKEVYLSVSQIEEFDESEETSDL